MSTIWKNYLKQSQINYTTGVSKAYSEKTAQNTTTATDAKEFTKRESDKAIGAVIPISLEPVDKAKGIDAITKKALEPLNMEVHHVIPLSEGGSNELDNLILIAPETHKQLHYGKDLDKRFEKYRKHLK